MPISAPSPNSPPSANWVEALTITIALSTSARKRSPAASSAVTIASAPWTVEAIAEVFARGGFRAPVVTDIRGQIWLKAWGNLSFNPISALTRATLAEICRFGPTRQLAADMMTVAKQIAEKLGVSFRITIEQRIEGAEQIGEHKTSMLQDVEARRPLELEALLGVVVELGRLTNTPTPSIDAIYACVKLLAKTIQA